MINDKLIVFLFHNFLFVSQIQFQIYNILIQQILFRAQTSAKQNLRMICVFSKEVIVDDEKKEKDLKG
jgi:hypothetical protein